MSESKQLTISKLKFVGKFDRNNFFLNCGCVVNFNSTARAHPTNN